MFKKQLLLLLATFMVVSMIPVNANTVYADENDKVSEVDFEELISNVDGRPQYGLGGRKIDYEPAPVHDIDNILEGEEGDIPAYYSVFENVCVSFGLKNYKVSAQDNKNLLFEGVVPVDAEEKFEVKVVEDENFSLDQCIYNGKVWKPAVEVTYMDGDNKVTLNSSQYKVMYYNNKKAGTAMIAVKGKGNYSKCTGTANFTIKMKEINSEDVIVKLPSSKIVYTGKERKPKVKVYYKDGTKNRLLKVNTDYKVSYLNNKNAGEESASVIVEFGNNYDLKGTELAEENKYDKKFSIEKARITTLKVRGTYKASLVDAANKKYDGDIDVKAYAKKINLAGEDYTLSVKDVVTDANGVPTKMLVTAQAKEDTNFTGEKTVVVKLVKDLQ